MAKAHFFIATNDRIAARYATVYKAGARLAADASASTSITVHAVHGVSNGNKLVYGLTRTNVGVRVPYTVSDVSSSLDTAITVSPALTASAESLLVNLEADTGLALQSDGSYTAPEFDGSTVTIYSDPNGDVTITNSTVTMEAGGEISFYADAGTYWIVVHDFRRQIVRVYPDIGPNPTSTVAGPVSSTDNAIARFDGTSGAILQDYSSNAPTITDAGAMTIPSTLNVDGAVDFDAALDVAGAVTMQTTLDVDGAARFKAGPWIDVTHADYGATGDGVTDDDVAIQAAATAVPASGGTLYFPAGTYLVGTTIYVKSNTHVRGAGMGNTIIKRMTGSLADGGTANTGMVFGCGGTAGNHYTTGASGSNITFSNLTINGNDSNFTSLTDTALNVHGIYARAVDGLVIRDCSFLEVLQTPIYVFDSRNVVIQGNRISDSGKWSVSSSRNAITVSGTPTASWCTKVVITGNNIYDIGDEGIAIFNWSNVVVSDNDIGQCDYGIEMSVTDTSNLEGTAIIGNCIHDSNAAGGTATPVGIVVSTSTGSFKGVTIIGNTIHSYAWNGMYLQGIDSLTVQGNTIYDCNTDVSNATYTSGIEAVTIENGVISDNSIQYGTAGAGVRGIKLQSTSVDCQIVGNVIDTPTAECILFTNGVTNSLVTGNRLVGGTYGVRLTNTGTNSGNTVLLNYSTGASTSALTDGSGQTNYIAHLDTASTLLTLTALRLKVNAADNERGLWLQNTTAASTLSPVIALADTAGEVFKIFKSATLLAIQNNSSATMWQLSDTGNMDVTGHIKGASTDVNVTGNDAIVTAARHLINLTNVSGTNTITLNAPSSKNGALLILRCAALTAGTMTLADSGNVVLSAAWAPDAGDTLTLVANGVLWYEIARSAN